MLESHGDELGSQRLSYAAGLSTSEGETKRRKKRGLLLGLTMVAGVVGFVVFLVSFRTGDLSVVESYLIDAEGRTYVTVVSRRWFRGGRGGNGSEQYEMSVFDPTTGEIVAHTELTERAHTSAFRGYRRVGHRLWTDSTAGVRLFDLRTAEPLWNQAELEARVPELAAGFKLSGETFNDYSPPTAGLPLVLADGRRAWLDMDAALHFEPVATDPWRPGYFCGPDRGAKPSCERKECIAFESVEGSVGMVVGRAPVWQESDIVQVDPSMPTLPKADAPQPFVLPGLVRLHETECAIELGGDVLVLHDSSTVAPKEVLLTRSTRSSGRRWTTPVNAMLPAEHEFEGALPEPHEAFVGPEGLFVLLTERRTKTHLVVAVLDPETGSVSSTQVLIGP